jgi:hypothetical protein
VIGGRYRLIELIGAGGMGRVWRSRDELLQRTVAVKEISMPSAALAAQAVREARAAARLDHPGVVKVFDVIRHDERSWIVMEHVPSRSLQAAVRDDGPMSPRRVAEIGLEVLAALRSAHACGVLHRDVKPDNVLLADDGRVVLTDFGLATIGLAISERDGGPDPRLGSPHYIAPERLRSEDSGVRSDLWSLGATLYAAVEGRPPFARADPESSLQALLTEEPDPPVLAGPLSGLLFDLLDKDPARRPPAPEVAARLCAIVTPEHRRAPKARLVAAASVALVLATGGAAVAAAGQRTGLAPVVVFPSTTAVSAEVPALGICGPGGAPVTAAVSNVPAGLPQGWIWSRDPGGFALALPAGWRRSTSGNEVCFSDPAGRRAFRVNVSPVVTSRPLAYWEDREKDADLPGYRRISMGVLLMKRGGADWEYTWRPDSGTVRHERRVLIAVTDDRSYLLRWAVADADWDANVALQRRLVELFGSAS